MKVISRIIYPHYIIQLRVVRGGLPLIILYKMKTWPKRKEYKIDYTTLAWRHKKWLKDDDLIVDIRKTLTVNVFWEDLTLTEIAKKHNIPRWTIQERYLRWKDIESLIKERLRK